MKIIAVSLEAVYTHTICLVNKIIDINKKKDSDINL